MQWFGGDVEQALDSISVPSYVLDKTGVVRWINPAAEQLLGDVRGRHYTSVVAPEDRLRARELFFRKVLGASATDATGVLVSDAASIRGASSTRAGTFYRADRRGAPPEHRDSPKPHPPPFPRPRREFATRGSRRRSRSVEPDPRSSGGDDGDVFR